jgi:hypothetical protein
MTELRAARKRRIPVALCAVAIPVSLWCFDLANHAVFPSGWLRQLLGPQARTGHTSAPDYMEWDIATMLLMLTVCGASTIYLGVRIVQRVRQASHR